MMSRSEICAEFKIDDFAGAVVFAKYEQGGYEGSAVVLFASDGKLFMVSASHCSCNGLEGSWDPDEVTVDMLKRMSETGYGVEKEAAQHTLAALDRLHEPDLCALEAAAVLSAL
jgi:hypothetical protein